MKKLYKLFIIAAVSLFGTSPVLAQYYVLNEGSSSVTLMNGWSKATDKSYTLTGPGKELTFELEKTSSAATGSFTVYAGSTKIKEIGVGELSKDNWKKYSIDLTSIDGHRSNRTIKFTAGGTLAKYLRNAKVTMDTYLDDPSATSLDFGSCNVSDAPKKLSFTIAWCNVPALQYSLPANSQYSVSIDNNAEAGKYNTATVEVTYNHTAAGTHNETLVITDTYNNYRQEISLSGSAVQIEAPSYTCDIASTYFVGDQIDLDAFWTSTSNADKVYDIVSFTSSSSINEGATEPAINGTMLTMNQAGTLNLKLTQSSNTNYYAGEDTKTITIAKRPNPVTVLFNGNTYASNTFNMAYGVGASVLVSTANESNTITIAQTAGADLATYYDDQHAVYTSYKPGTASWLVSQPENYKYLAASATFTVNIAPVNIDDYLVNVAGDCKAVDLPSMTWDCDLAGVLTFEAYKNMATAVGDLRVDAFIGDKWVEVMSIGVGSLEKDSYKSFSVDLTNKNARGIRFVNEGSYSRYIRNVKVENLAHISTSITAAEGLRIPDCRLGESKTATFNINWSRPTTSHNIHIESDNAHFTLSKNVIDNVSCNHGSTPITVTYTPVEAGEEDATLTIYDESQVITLVVHGKVVDKFTPEIDWLIPAIVKPNTSYVGLNNIVTSNSASPLVITSSDETIATYDAATQTLQTYDKEGFVVFTVSQTANEDFHAITLQFSVFVTNKESQMCILYEDGSKHSLSDVANANVGEFDINLDAPVSMISADIWKTNSIATGSIVVKWSDGDGNNLGEKEVGVEKLTTSAKNFVMQLPRDTRKLSFKVKGTLNKYVQNIKVYRAQYLEHNAVLTDGALDFGSDEYNAEPTIREFDILYSGAGDFSVSLSNNELFTVESVSETIDCANAWGTKHISVAYNHNIVSNDHTATLNAQLGTMVFSIPLVGTTDRPSEAVFNGDFNDDWTKPENWLGGVTPAENADIVIKGNLVISDGESRTVHSLNIESTGSVLVVNNGTLTINAASSPAAEYGDLHVNTGGVVIVHDELKVRNLYLEATPISNQGATLAGTTQVNGNAYLDIHMDPSGTLNDRNYYSFSLPFASSQVQRYNKKTSDWESALSGRDYRAYYYDEQERATNGKSNATWIPTATFQPGVFYLIEFANADANTYRFMCSDLSSLNNSESIQLSSSSAADDSDRGWNGIGNTGIGYANPNLSCAMQALDGDNNAFTLVEGSSALAMGRAVFVQVDAAAELSWTPSVSPALAPRRVEASVDETYTLNINRLGSDDRDDCLRLIVSDDAQPSYQIGHDLVKMSMGQAKVAQMWINAYDQQLVINEVALNDGIVNCDLGLYAPAAAEYEIALQDLPTDGTMIYLTRDGKAVANLTYGSYVLDLQKGNTTGYGIRVNRRKVVTDIDELLTTDTPAAKQLINGTLYIIRGARVYDMQGRLIHE